MWTLLYVLLLHWLGDFVCQTRWMANGKSKAYAPLLVHVLTYGLVLSLGLGWLVPFHQLLGFIGLNVGLHMAIDAVTSRMTSFFWEKKWIHPFFTTIGFDQMIHTACLLWTSHWLLGVQL